MSELDKAIEAYIKRVELGKYVPCELCGKYHDDGGIKEYKGKQLYVCFDCLEKEN